MTIIDPAAVLRLTEGIPAAPKFRTITPAAVLRLAEGVPVTPENFRIINELKAALKDLVAIADRAAS